MQQEAQFRPSRRQRRILCGPQVHRHGVPPVDVAVGPSHETRRCATCGARTLAYTANLFVPARESQERVCR